MKSLAATCTVLMLLVLAGITTAEMFLIDDFESYDVDTTIHLKGIDAGGGGEGGPPCRSHGGEHDPVANTPRHGESLRQKPMIRRAS